MRILAGLFVFCAACSFDGSGGRNTAEPPDAAVEEMPDAKPVSPKPDAQPHHMIDAQPPPDACTGKECDGGGGKG